MLYTLWDPIVFTSMEYIKLNRLSLRVWRANCVYNIGIPTYRTCSDLILKNPPKIGRTPCMENRIIWRHLQTAIPNVTSQASRHAKLTEVLEQGHKTVICEDVYFLGLYALTVLQKESQRILLYFYWVLMVFALIISPKDYFKKLSHKHRSNWVLQKTT